MTKPITSQTQSSEKALAVRQKLFDLFAARALPDEELMVNLSLYMRSGVLAKMLFLNEMYEKIIKLPGVIMEFGVWRGQSIVLFENLRAVHEPYNHSRRIYGFDTFDGYPEIGEHDKRSDIISENTYAVGADYVSYLEELIDYHEQENVMSHIKKHSLIKGDASITCPQLFKDRPETLVAMAYFDMALYKPTKACLEVILPRMVKGGIIVFDELCHPDYPGETQAFMETIGPQRFTMTRSRFLPDRVFVTIG
ncbi:MAG: dTDP-6-deoxy-L-hexose 3-O-methyltransferase [Rhodocyclales bacterium]|nr:dTDP-6-deoxy-L-hexose 3-O-methyltransferase [Rhodocyclales bacterium]